MSFSTFVINLDASADRLAYMRGELSKAGIPFERIPGILGTAMPDHLRPYFFDAAGALASPLKRGEIGCHAAHLAVCRRIVGDGIPAALVLEDDARFIDGFAGLIENLFKILPSGWDVVRLSSPPKRAYVPLAPLGGGHDLVRYSKIPNVAAAYLITLSGAQKMLKPGIRTHALDEYMRRPWLNGLDTFGVVPAPVAQAGLRSNIDAVESRIAPVKESALSKSLRKSDFSNFWGRLRTDIQALGFARWSACLAVNGADRIYKRLSGRTLIHAAARKLKRPPEGVS